MRVSRAGIKDIFTIAGTCTESDTGIGPGSNGQVNTPGIEVVGVDAEPVGHAHKKEKH